MREHHAYFFAGSRGVGEERARRFATRVLGSIEGNPDAIFLSYDLLSVEEARTLKEVVLRTSVRGESKVVVVSLSRFFHEAQNALLKVFEEPPEGTYLVLVVPSAGILLPTLRSRLLPLPEQGTVEQNTESVGTLFIKGGKKEREKIIEALLKRAKSDKEEEKSLARAEALELIEEMTRTAYAKNTKTPSKELSALLSDLASFTPMLHDRATPLKPILEHLLIVTPEGLR